jgi:hypothetical protein
MVAGSITATVATDEVGVRAHRSATVAPAEKPTT